MSRRSAPFVAPSDINSPINGYIDDPISKEGKKQAKILLSTLQEDITSFRDQQFPPDILRQIRDMPIYEGNLAEVQAYQQRWQNLIERAMAFYPAAYLPPDHLPLPASLEIPQFIYHVQRLHLTKTRAKESKSFGSVGALTDKCGNYTPQELERMAAVFDNDDEARLVAHREFIDLRAYVFCRDQKGEMLEPERIRFYRTGLIVHALPDFKIVDSRQTPRKRRNDAYNNPLADNDVWKIYRKK
ncbi:hypothetical protein [Psychrobacter sp. LV10R520-6]|uniref:hypothetical protein n=1 Tax=Psychrobacter sp. LV10R520-6 TaxID=1415574 RepID=UPI0024C9E2C9|nr:hypothetical protein [Psychrobacter sp. LV10R520-6]SNT70543.1 hypothetical protein SAMN04488491_1717 [Psychrobacter sp. LV10R520-6]